MNSNNEYDVFALEREQAEEQMVWSKALRSGHTWGMLFLAGNLICALVTAYFHNLLYSVFCGLNVLLVAYGLRRNGITQGLLEAEERRRENP